MARFARVVAIGVPHHITQRGNARRQVFDRDADYLVYLSLLREGCRLHKLAVVGYCLMSNHVRLVAVPHQADAMSLALRHAHGRYGSFLNAAQSSSGHVWQGRFYSCPLDDSHLWSALRYVELNPVRAGMVGRPEAYEWSSAAAHCSGESDGLLDCEAWRSRWTVEEWREFVGDTAGDEHEAEALRASTHTGRPLGSEDFVHALEFRLGRHLARRRAGRPRDGDAAQPSFGF